ncbi:alginate export family protein [Undibacterium sp. SXout11W]|uniref:alginate export family protein n=1 Tax=Undibacterium sp. SXout11W TaxID=3413050 RepID=UPI003BEF9A97
MPKIARASFSFLVALAILLLPFYSHAADADFTGARIESISVAFDNGQENTTFKNAVLRVFSANPGSRFYPTQSNLFLNKVKRLNFVQNASYSITSTANGDVAITLNVKLNEEVRDLAEKPIGLFNTGNWADFPSLYADDRTVIQSKLENKTMIFSNTHAFFGNPQILTAGNPLAEAPSGSRGTDNWLESSVELGLYGLTSLSKRVSAFGGVSYITSGSWGNELFTDRTRSHGGVEDAYVGFIGSDTTDSGGIRQMSFLYGRKAFQIDSGMILRLASANGGDRASLQSNPRNAAEHLVDLQFVYDNHKLQFFRLDPDELDAINSHTVIEGINYEGQFLNSLRLGAMILRVPQSDFSYYTTTATYSRKGLKVIDLRAAYEPTPDVSNIFIRGELAHQTNDNFSMNAKAGYAEAGYRFSKVAWTPTLSYRYSSFSGDQTGSSTFQRWDPLFAGGSGEEWVQGLNEYKVIQTSNVNAHRIMVRLQPTPQWELTPQLWFFKADGLNNLGGAQALSMLQSYDLGKEINMTARYISSKNLIFVFSVAYTQPGDAIRLALNNNYKNWTSASALMIARF